MWLCGVDELADPDSRGFTLATAQGQLDVVLVKCRGRFYAYRNRCPHTGINLEWRGNQFLDFSGQYVQCATHGALFDPQDGLCLRGPCVGQRLEPLSLVTESGVLYLEPEA